MVGNIYCYEPLNIYECKHVKICIVKLGSVGDIKVDLDITWGIIVKSQLLLY